MVCGLSLSSGSEMSFEGHGHEYKANRQLCERIMNRCISIGGRRSSIYILSLALAIKANNSRMYPK